MQRFTVIYMMRVHYVQATAYLHTYVSDCLHWLMVWSCDAGMPPFQPIFTNSGQSPRIRYLTGSSHMQQEQLWLLHEALPLIAESCNHGPINNSVIGSNSNLHVRQRLGNHSQWKPKYWRLILGETCITTSIHWLWMKSKHFRHHQSEEVSECAPGQWWQLQAGSEVVSRTCHQWRLCC